MNDIQVYSTQQCPNCVRAKALLQLKGLDYSETDITNDSDLAQEMIDRSGNRTVPQIFINGEAIGGFDELSVLNNHGKL